MKGFTTTTARSLWLLGGLLGLVGCAHYRDVVDPCYPERYQAMARREFNAAYAPQVQNGVVLDQTVWDSQFEPSSDRLNSTGIEKLNYIIRRRPAPVSTVYVQTAQTMPYDPAHPERFQTSRENLDTARKRSVEKYLAMATHGRNLTFNVELHDPSTPGIHAAYANTYMRILQLGPPYGPFRPTGQNVQNVQFQGSTTGYP